MSDPARHDPAAEGLPEVPMTHRPASLPPLAALGGAVLLLGAAVGCAPAGSTGATAIAPTSQATDPLTTGAPSLATSPTPVASARPTDIPRPAGTLALPTTFQVELADGRYFTQPPFVIPFSIEISEPGWYTGHLNPVFVDLQRWDGVSLDAFPTHIFGFGWPSNIRAKDSPVPVAGLTPDAAFDLLADRRALVMTNRSEVELFGREGVIADFHSEVNNNPIFGTEDGNFGLGPELDLRLAAVPLRDGLLMVAVQAAPDDLDDAWDQAAAILATYDHLEE
jgi:hypothetical protein